MFRTIARSFAVATFALASGACGGGDVVPTSGPLPTLTSQGGPEIILLRVTRNGGFPRGYRWPSIDVPVWTGSERLPALDRILAFDDAGQVAFVAANGRAGRIDLRNGKAELSAKAVVSPTSIDGVSVFGISTEGRLWRSTPGNEWRGLETDVDSVFALPGGYLVMAKNEPKQTLLIRVRPPASTPQDTIRIPVADEITRTANGDRLYAHTPKGITAIDTRTWRIVPGPKAKHPGALVATPSGDRVYVLDDNGRAIRIWQRFAERPAGTIPLLVPASDLHMDPLGRFLLAKTELTDSAFVISVPQQRVIRTVPTEWRADLPTVAPDGSILTLRREDVHALDPVTGVRKRRLRGAANDLWMFVRYDGFRPRDSSLDTPATFDIDLPVDSAREAEKIDSLLSARAEIVERERLDSVARAGSSNRSRGDTLGLTYTLSFASLFSESAARALADRIRVDGRPPRVVASGRDGITIYRVVLGPYPTRDAAEAAGRRSGVSYWVFVGLP